MSVDYKKVSTYYLIGNFFNKGIVFLTIPIFSRILSTTDYGIVTTYNSWIGILTMILGFALHMGIRMSFVDFKENVEDFLSTIILFTVLCSIGTIPIVILIAEILKINVSITLIVLCLLQAMATAILQDYSYYLMMQYRYKVRTFLMIMPNLLSVLVSIYAILYIFEKELYLGRIIPTALINCLFGIIIVLIVIKNGRLRIEKKYIKYGLAISAPLILHGIALNILSQSDRTMITVLADASQTGIYSLIYNLGMIATVITTSMEGVWTPWFLKKMEERNITAINKRVVDYVNLMTYAMVSLILVAPEMVRILADKEYWEGIIIIPPIVIANYIIFMYTLYVNVEHFHKKIAFITTNTFVAAIVNIALNFIFIPKFGYVAAAYTTVTAYVVALLLHAFYAKKIDPLVYPLKMFIKPLIHIGVTTCVFYVFQESIIIRWAILVVYLAIIVICEKNKIIELFPKLRRKK